MVEPARIRVLRSGLIGALSALWLGAPVEGRAQVTLEPVLEAAAPLDVTHAGDQRLFIVEKAGRIRVFDRRARALQANPLLDLQGKVSLGEEQGLLSLAFHPDFRSNGFFYVSYTDLAGANVVERHRIGSDGAADPASARRLLRIARPFPNNNGGQLQIGPADGQLYVSIGDGGGEGDPGCRSQQPGELLGKLLRLDVRQNLQRAPFYGIPPDNPFAGGRDPEDRVRDEVWAVGLRNPFRFSFDRASADLYIADVGGAVISGEINLERHPSRGGANYGWKVMDGLSCFERTGCSDAVPVCGSPELTPPVFEASKTGGDCAIVGGFVYRGKRAPELVGSYVFGDFCTGTIRVLEQDPAGRFQARSIASAGEGLNGFGQDADGGLYVLTLRGPVFELVSASTRGPAQGSE
jgi:glucose/arabinose dehydrogenase